MAENQNDEQQNGLLESLQALSGRQGGPLESALAEFLNGEGTLHEATRAASAESGKEISTLVKILVDQFNIPPSLATIIATMLIKLMPSIGKAAPKKRRTPRKKKPTTGTGKKAKPKTSTGKKKSSAKKSTEKKKLAAREKTAARKKPTSTAKRRKPSGKRTRAVTIEDSGETT